MDVVELRRDCLQIAGDKANRPQDVIPWANEYLRWMVGIPEPKQGPDEPTPTEKPAAKPEGKPPARKK